MAQEHFFDEFDPTLIEPDYDTLKIVGEYYSRYETQNTRARIMAASGYANPGSFHNRGSTGHGKQKGRKH